jgi:hypothetical protein
VVLVLVDEEMPWKSSLDVVLCKGGCFLVIQDDP